MSYTSTIQSIDGSRCIYVKLTIVIICKVIIIAQY